MNKYMLSASILISLLLIVSVTTYKVVDIHHERLLLVNSKYIIEQAKKCINDKKCNSDKITLKELYDLNYLKRAVNPVTKEYYSDTSFVELKDNDYVFIDKY